MKHLLTTVSLVSILFASGMAMAADLSMETPPSASMISDPGVWADFEVLGGYEQSIDTFFDDADTKGYYLGGEARFGIGLAEGFALQMDALANLNYMKGSDFEDEAAVSDLAAHASWAFESGIIGVMASAGQSQDNPAWGTVAVEGAFKLTESLRVVAQAGYSVQLWDHEDGVPTAPYIHADLQYLVTPDLMISGNLGYVAPWSDEGTEKVWRYGLKAEYAFTPNVSGVAEWQSIYRVEADSPDDIVRDDRILFGLRLHTDEDSLFDSSPLHDYNWISGVNNHFEF